MPRIDLTPGITGNSCGDHAAFECVGHTAGYRAPFDSYQIFADVVKVAGRHNLKAGADLRMLRKSQASYGNSQGSYQFRTDWTKGPLNNSTSAPLGQEFASLLLGLPTGGALDLNAFRTGQFRLPGLSAFSAESFRRTKSRDQFGRLNRSSISLLANHTYSKLIERTSRRNDSDSFLEKRGGPDDHPQRVVGSASWELPCGRGKALSFNNSALWNRVLGGFVVNAIYTWQIGAPLSWGNVIYYGGEAFDTTRFNTISSRQLANNIRKLPSRIGNLRQDGANNWDLSVIKNTAITRTSEVPGADRSI